MMLDIVNHVLEIAGEPGPLHAGGADCLDRKHRLVGGLYDILAIDLGQVIEIEKHADTVQADRH
jgi:hypothetical protein